MAQIEAAKEQVRIEADKELALKELKLKVQQDQASTILAAAQLPCNLIVKEQFIKSPKLPSFIDEDELDSYLLRFERHAENAS